MPSGKGTKLGAFFFNEFGLDSKTFAATSNLILSRRIFRYREGPISLD